MIERHRLFDFGIPISSLSLGSIKVRQKTCQSSQSLLPFFPMSSILSSLLHLQELDKTIISLQEEARLLDEEYQQAEEEIQAKQRELDSCQKALKEQTLHIKQAELDLQTRNTSLQRLKTQQYETKKNDEFQALGIEIERCQSHIDQLETLELEALELADRLEEKHQQAQRLFSEEKALHAKTIKAILIKQKSCAQSLKTKQSQRDGHAATIEPMALSLYQRLMKTKPGSALVCTKNRQCGGCYMKLVPETLISLQKSDTLTQCENCGRILYLSETTV